jgi:hypothetical protein
METHQHGMEIRQYDIYIDGVRLPEHFLPDADTQLFERNDFTFDSCVERTGALRDEIFGDIVYSSEVFDPEIPGLHFARFGRRRMSFRLQTSAEQGVGVKLMLKRNSGPAEWRVDGVGNESLEFRYNAWHELAWGCRYLFTGTLDGENRRMTVEVRRCRVPLGELRSSLTNRTPAPRQLVRPRWSSFVGSI